jgi:hypothetical protein
LLRVEHPDWLRYTKEIADRKCLILQGLLVEVPEGEWCTQEELNL